MPQPFIRWKVPNCATSSHNLSRSQPHLARLNHLLPASLPRLSTSCMLPHLTTSSLNLISPLQTSRPVLKRSLPPDLKTRPQVQYLNFAQQIATQAWSPPLSKAELSIKVAQFRTATAKHKPNSIYTSQGVRSSVNAFNHDRSTVHEQVYGKGPQCDWIYNVCIQFFW